VHVVVPDSLDDPTRPSGGNTYDRRVCAGLQDLGWVVHVHPLRGGWPHPHPSSVAELARTLAALPDDALVLVDGLLASGHADVLLPAARRLRVVALVHLPLGHPLATEAHGGRNDGSRGAPADQEREVLAALGAVLTTSRWTADWLLTTYHLPVDRVHIAQPGADRAPRSTGTASGGALLSVAAVVPAKGHDALLDALASLRDRSWQLVCAGSLDLAPDHVARLRHRVSEAGIADRVTFAGPLAAQALDRAYAAADLLVVASRIETYGLVVTEALARALPVVAIAAGGVEEAIGDVVGRGRPGILVGPEGTGLADALRGWLDDAELRKRLVAVAQERRTALEPWSATALRVSDVLSEVGARTAYGRLGAGPRRTAPVPLDTRGPR
jgi:glycosyltransferase involved in cell wall biosynthesis